MEEIFSSNSKEVIQKQLNICLDNKLTLKSKDELDFYFDVSKITIWIQENQFKRVITNSETIEVKANFRIEPNRTKLDRTELNPINSIFSNRFQIFYYFYKKFGLTEHKKKHKNNFNSVSFEPKIRKNFDIFTVLQQLFQSFSFLRI